MSMVDVIFISDYVCPYCLVAKEALKQALAATDIEADVRYQPFELTEEPKPRVDTYHDEVRRSHYQVLVEPCRQLGLDMKLPPKVVPRPYTRLAFEGWFYASAHGLGDRWNDLMYSAYFMDEKDIGDAAVLAELAAGIGLDRGDFAAALREGRYTAQEKAAVARTRETWSPRGVPSIYMNGTKVQIAAFTVEEMAGLLRDAQSGADEGLCCGPEGC